MKIQQGAPAELFRLVADETASFWLGGHDAGAKRAFAELLRRKPTITSAPYRLIMIAASDAAEAQYFLRKLEPRSSSDVHAFVSLSEALAPPENHGGVSLFVGWREDSRCPLQSSHVIVHLQRAIREK